MQFLLPVSWFVLALFVAVPGWAGEVPRTGGFKTTFTERHPESGLDRMRARNGWSPQPASSHYDLAKEEFDVYVPKEYDGTAAYGLIAFVNSGKGGGPPGQYRDLLGKHRLIWVGACNVENERSVVVRMGLTLDAVWNMRKLYRIDPQRIYASGTSGGGRVVSMLAPSYADVFSGGIYLIGCNSPKFPVERDLAKTVREQAQNNRYALMTGSKDFNQPGTKQVFDALKGMGFKHVEYFEQPGLEHSNPSGEWWEKGVLSVDRPLIEAAQTMLTQARTLEARRAYDACRIYRQIVHAYPIAREATEAATARLAELAPAVDEGLRAELAKLATANGERQRAFVQRAEGFPCEADARILAEATGGKELDAVLAQPGATLPSRLIRFQSSWEGYDCGARAAEAYDGLAAKALEPIAALPADRRTRALAKFLKDWQPSPSRARAAERLEADLSSELDAILAVERPQTRAGRLATFIKTWTGTTAAGRAQSELEALTPAKP